MNRFVVGEENVVLSPDMPFYDCFLCRSFRKGCSGPNLNVLETIEDVCQFLQFARIFQDMSYADVEAATIAYGHPLSIATIKRILTLKIGDPSHYSIRVLTVCIVGDPNGTFSCAIPNIIPDTESMDKLRQATIELERVLIDNEDHRKALDNIHASYQKELDDLRIDHRAAMDASVQHYEREIAAKEQQIQRLRMMIDHLTEENSRKSRMIDKFVDSHFSPIPKD